MQQFVVQHPGLFAACNLLLVLLIFSVVGLIISYVSGWHSLAERYRTERELPERRRRMQSAQMRWLVGYNNALTLGSDGEGIYVAVTIPIFAGHPRLFIPWSDVIAEEPRRWLFLMVRTFRLGPDEAPFRVREPLARFLLEPRGGNAPPLGTIGSTF